MLRSEVRSSYPPLKQNALWVCCSWLVCLGCLHCWLSAFPGYHEDPELYKEPAFSFFQTAHFSKPLLHHLLSITFQSAQLNTLLKSLLGWSFSMSYFINNCRHSKPDSTLKCYPPANLSLPELRVLYNVVFHELTLLSFHNRINGFISTGGECSPVYIWHIGSCGFDLQHKSKRNLGPHVNEPVEIWTWSFCPSTSCQMGLEEQDNLLLL